MRDAKSQDKRNPKDKNGKELNKDNKGNDV